MKISTLETQSGIPIAIGAETKQGLKGLFYLESLISYSRLLEDLDFPLSHVYSLNGKGAGLICEMQISKEARRFLSNNPYFSQDEDLSALVRKSFEDNSAPRISISCDFKTGSYEIKPYC